MIEIYEDGRRYKSSIYNRKGTQGFLLGESIADGSLITEFDGYGEVLEQAYIKDKNTLEMVKNYLRAAGIDNDFTIKKKEYQKVVVDYACPICNKKSIVRELDLHSPEAISKVPVVPIYVCTSCNKKFYSMTDAYLKRLVEKNRGLFEEKESIEIAKNPDSSIKEMQEYIIRIFASKRISRIAIKK